MWSRIKIALAGILFLGSALMLNSCVKSEEAKANAENSAVSNASKVFPVRVAPIKKQVVSKTLEYTANLIPFMQVHYAPASPGRIDKIYVEEGSRVKKGQLLVEMDKTQLNQSLTQYNNAKLYLSRVDTLYRLNSMSEQQYDESKTQYDLAKYNYEYLLKNTNLLSPLNGIVTGKYFENGEFYTGSPNTSDGKPAIISLMQIDPLKAVVNISQRYYPQVKEGMKAKISTSIYPDRIFEGTIYKIHPTIDAGTRSFETEILIKNSDEILRPGMFSSIEIIVGQADALVVPAISVLKQDGTNTRFVYIRDNSKAKRVEVEIGKRFDDQIEVISDNLTVGDMLIVEGQANLLNGSQINVIGN